MQYKSISKPVSDPARRAPAPPSEDFRFKEKAAPGVHTISTSKDGRSKMVVIIGKNGKKKDSRTYHLKKRDGNWFGIHGYKASDDGILSPIMRSF